MTLNGSGSYNPGQGYSIDEYNWYINDEYISSGEIILVEFTNAGEHIIKLVVINDNEESASEEEVLLVYEDE